MRSSFLCSLALTLLLSATGHAQPTPARQAPPKIIHVFVALCDNASQGIVKVPAAIGNGDDAAGNLYWGCADGAKTVFSGSHNWVRLRVEEKPAPAVLERAVFEHRTRRAYLVADAYRGREIRQALTDFLQAAAGGPVTSVPAGSRSLRAGGGADLVAYIGHNGLMDFKLPAIPAGPASGKSVIVLCCRSHEYFYRRLRQSGATPLLTTTQFMYPGAFILHDVLEGWLAGKPAAELRQHAASAYAANQKIGERAAAGVFSAE